MNCFYGHDGASDAFAALTYCHGIGAALAPRFPDRILNQLRDRKGLRIRAGTGTHRFIGIWVVVVENRVFVRSWSVKPDGWYSVFCVETRGMIRIADRDLPVVAVPMNYKRVLDAIDRSYLDKYNTPGAIKYARDLGSPKSRAATLELRPFQRVRNSSNRVSGELPAR